MKTFQRILAIALALIMSLSVLGTVAFADETIDKNATGSITIHKYETETKGDNGDGTDLGGNAPTADGLEGVTFTIYQVMDADEVVAYYNGTNTDAVDVSNYVTDGAIKSGYTAADTQTTDENGVAKFEDLAVGMYVVIETAYPDKVTTPSEPFLVSIPMTNPSNETAWMYDVHVYPKNSTSEGNVTLIKKDDDGNALAGVTFTLEKQNGASWVDAATGDVGLTPYTTGSNGKIEFTELAHGTYRLTEAKTAEGYILDGRPITFTVNTDNTITCNEDIATVTTSGSGKALTIEIVNEKPTITKEVTTDINEAGVGSTVAYKLTVEVPQNIAALATFKVTDAPTNIAVDKDSIVVICGSQTLVKDTDYTVADNTANTNGFVINFVPAEIGDYAGENLIITYNATVLASAANTNTASNTATLTYSDKIGTDSTASTEDVTASAEVHNFKIDITKRLDSAAGDLAEGVEFKLYDANDNVVKATKTGDVYVVDASGPETLTTDADGKIVISGLAEGTYYLKETKTVDGYNLLSGVIEIDLNTTDVADYSFEQTIVNKKGFTLPETGGIGTLMFIIIGGVLVAGGICLITVPGKKRSV